MTKGLRNAMAERRKKPVKVSALLLANDLRTGLTVYLTDSGDWSLESSEAWQLPDETAEKTALAFAAEAEKNNTIVGSYLVDAATDGSPTHIREQLRVAGPSINYRQNQS